LERQHGALGLQRRAPRSALGCCDLHRELGSFSERLFKYASGPSLPQSSRTAFYRDRQDGTRGAEDVLANARTPRFPTRHLHGSEVSGSGAPDASLPHPNLDGGNNSSLPVKAPKDPSPPHPAHLPRPALVANASPRMTVHEAPWSWASCGAVLARATAWLAKRLLMASSSAGWLLQGRFSASRLHPRLLYMATFRDLASASQHERANS
jgi:hypothetical protein